MAKTLKQNKLPRFVGRAELADALGISIKTLGRRVNDGEYPRPVKLSANRVGWHEDTISDPLLSRAKGVTQRAVDSPDKLKPDEVADALHGLSVRALAAAGHNVPAADIVGVSVLAKATPEQKQAAVDAANAAQQAAMQAVLDAYGRLDRIRAALVVAGLMPALRPAMAVLLEGLTGRALQETTEQLQTLAIDIIDQALAGEFVGPAAPQSDASPSDKLQP